MDITLPKGIIAIKVPLINMEYQTLLLSLLFALSSLPCFALFLPRLPVFSFFRFRPDPSPPSDPESSSEVPEANNMWNEAINTTKANTPWMGMVKSVNVRGKLHHEYAAYKSMSFHPRSWTISSFALKVTAPEVGERWDLTTAVIPIEFCKSEIVEEGNAKKWEYVPKLINPSHS